MTSALRIGDLIRVPPVQTVIHLADGRRHSETVVASFVLTDEVRAHLSILAEAFGRDRGRGYFLQGDFGSGKSHFLAALAAWLGDRPGAAVLDHHHPDLKRLRDSGRRFLAVDVSLVNYRATTALERIVIEAVESALAQTGAPAALTPRGEFLDRLRRILDDPSLRDAFAEQVGIDGRQFEAWSGDHPRRAYLEGVRFLRSIGMEAPETLVEERHETLARALDAVAGAGFDGLVLIVDELSEFFRSKPDARVLNEDARTLQLLGELCGRRPLWIIAAVQESIERTGDIAQVTFAKIKDRFPVKMALSTLHIKALIARRLVETQPAAEAHLQRIHRDLQQQFVSFDCAFEEFRATYPVHPTTIALLDGLGELFSEHRGVVDFVHSQLAGDPSRRIAGILDRPAHELLGPDSIYDHFSGRLAEFSAFHVYPRHIVPHLDEVIERAIETAEDRTLARRIVRMLVLYAIHPTAQPPSVQRLAELSACTLWEHDPKLNVQFVAEAICDRLVAESPFFVKQETPDRDPLGAVYRITSREDPERVLQARIAHTAAGIPADDSRLLVFPLSQLAASTAWPGPELFDRGLIRNISWCRSPRRVHVVFALPGRHPEALQLADEHIADGRADFSVVATVTPIELETPHVAQWHVALETGDQALEALRRYLAAHLVATGLKPSSPADAALLEPSRRVLETLAPVAQAAALDAFFGGRFTDPAIVHDPVLVELKRFDRLLELAAEPLLQFRYPKFRDIAPRKTMASIVNYRRLIEEFIVPGRLSLQKAHQRRLSEAIEGLAAPLGLVELRGGTYLFAPDPEGHPLLAELFGRIGAAGRTPLKELMEALSQGRFGVPPETVRFLLTALAHAGLVTLMKNGRALPVELLGLTRIESADAVAPGRMIGRQDRQTLLDGCSFLAPSDGWPVFGLRQQREAWQAVIRFGKWSRKAGPKIEARTSAVGQYSAFENFDFARLEHWIRALAALAETIQPTLSPRAGLERFLAAWRASGLTADRIAFLEKFDHFIAQQADRFVFIHHYVRHGAVAQAAADDERVDGLLAEVNRLLGRPEDLIEHDRITDLEEAFEGLKAAYEPIYRGRHDRFYRSMKPSPLGDSARRALRVVERLADIDPLDRPRGLDPLLKRLRAPRPAVCRHHLSEELLRSPVCRCGFIPGQTTEPPAVADPEAEIDRVLNEYAEILNRPQVKEAVSSRIFALSDAQPETVRRLRSLEVLTGGRAASASALVDLLDADTTAEISLALTGRVEVVKRPIMELATALSGRRLKPEQVMEAVREWVRDVDPDTVVAVEDDDPQIAEKATQPPHWWSLLHPELFSRASDPPPDVRREMMAGLETRLARHFPAPRLRGPLSQLDPVRLLDFVVREPFHAAAVEVAWGLLARRILSGDRWPAGRKISSRYVDADDARRIETRLDSLRRFDQYRQHPYPQRLQARLVLAQMIADPWASEELRDQAFDQLRQIESDGHGWSRTLTTLTPIELEERPVVVVLDGVPPDVWMDAWPRVGQWDPEPQLRWFRIPVPADTASGMAVQFGAVGESLDLFAARDIDYHQVGGSEEAGLDGLLPRFDPDRTTVIRVALIDTGAHKGYLQLWDMPAAVARFLQHELPGLTRRCREPRRPLILTTDHGLSLTPRGLTHGRGGIYECTVFRLRWEG